MMKKMVVLVFSIALIFAFGVYAQEKSKPKKAEKSTPAKKEDVKLKPEVQKPVSDKIEEKKVEHRWVNIFPIGMEIYSLVVDPQNPDTIYASTYKGLFKSIDGGKLWNSLMTISEKFESSVIKLDPVDSKTLYWAKKMEEGEGEFWKISKDGSVEDISGGIIKSVHDFAINPKSTNVIYLITGTNDLYKTLNGGKTWGKIGERARWLYLNPDSPDELYVCCEEKGDTWSGVFSMLKHSINGGQSFELVAPYKLDSEGKKERCRSWNVTYNGNEMFAGCVPSGMGKEDVNIIKSSDGGKTWDLIANKAFSVNWNGHDWDYDLIPHPTDKNMLYSILDNETEKIKILKSTDGGKTWTPLPSSPAQKINSFKISPSNTIYVTTDQGIYKTADEGVNWQSASFGLPARIEDKKLISLDPKDNTIYMGTENGYWTSNDKGYSYKWHPSKDLPLSQVFYTSDGVIYFVYFGDSGRDPLGGSKAISSHGVYKVASDQKPISLNFNSTPMFLAVSPSNSQVLYAVATKSDSSFLSNRYFSGGEILLKSEDGGFSWAEIDWQKWLSIKASRHEIALLSIDSQSPNVLYAVVTHIALGLGATPPSRSFSLLKTTDGGTTWIDISQSLYKSIESLWASSKWLNPKERSDIASMLVSSIASVVIDPSNSNIVYIVTSKGGVYRSDDGGKNWKLKTPMDYLKTLVSTFDDYSSQKCKEKRRKDCKVTLQNSATMKSWQVGFFINVPPNYVVVSPDEILNRAGVSFNNISINPSDPKTVYLATNVGVYRSSDRGDTWQRLNNGLLEPAVKKVIASSSLVLAEGESGIYKLTE